MLFRPHRVVQTRTLLRPTKIRPNNVYNVHQRRNFINQLPGIMRLHKAQMGHDLKRVGTLVLIPPLLVASYITVCGILGFVGAQIWLEYFAMRPGREKHAPTDIDWGWETIEDWSGGVKGGTDSSLGMLARIAIRSAWLFNTWAGQMGQQNVYTRSKTSSSYIQNAIFGSTDRAHALAEQSLAWALEYMDRKNPERPIPNPLLLRHADILEHIATPGALSGARREVLSVYRELPRGSYERSTLALRLGGLYLAEGVKEKAVRLWKEAVNVRPTGEGQTYTPAEERLIADAYLQLSAIYSTDSKLDQADEIQQQASRTLGHFLRPDRTAGDETPAQVLHALYLTHRKAVLSIHAAEVHYAQTRDVKATLSQLEAAVAQAATIAHDLSMENHSESTSATATQSASSSLGGLATSSQQSSARLSNSYSDSSVLQMPAISLLRDARRAAMQALVLEGLLLESLAPSDSTRAVKPNTRNGRSGEPDSLILALVAYQQALEWAGTTLKAAQALGVPEQEIWHVRAKAEGLQRQISKEKASMQ